jgi:hypothetical protein
VEDLELQRLLGVVDLLGASEDLLEQAHASSSWAPERTSSTIG